MSLWNLADDAGRGTANPRELLGFAFPNDENIDVGAVRRMCADVSAHYGVIFYEVAGRPYFAIPSWHRHQKLDARRTGKHPTPDEAETVLYQGEHEESAHSRRTVGADSRTVGAGTGEQGNRGTGEQGNTYVGTVSHDRVRETGHSNSQKQKPEPDPEPEIEAEVIELASAPQAAPRRRVDGWSIVRDETPNRMKQAHRVALATSASEALKAGTDALVIRQAIRELVKRDAHPADLRHHIADQQAGHTATIAHQRPQPEPQRRGYGAATSGAMGWLDPQLAEDALAMALAEANMQHPPPPGSEQTA